MRWFLSCLLAICFVWASFPSTASARVEVEVSNLAPTTGEYVEVRLNTDSEPIGQPRFPEMPGWAVTPGGRETKMQFINGRRSSSWTFRWTMVTTRAGSHSLGPIEVNTRGGGRERTAAQRLLVTAVPERASSDDKASAGAPDVFVQASISDQQVYVGEPIIYTFQLANAVNVDNPRYSEPDWGGLVPEPGITGQRRQYRAIVQGRTYQIQEVRAVRYSLRPGTYEITPAEGGLDILIGASRGGLFQRVQRRAWADQTEAFTVEVLPLPAPVPDDYIGLVGEIEVEATLSPRELELGGSATQTVTLRGSGLLNGSSLALEAPEGARVYEDEPEHKLELVDAGVEGYLRLRQAVVPQEAGSLELPAQWFHTLRPDGSWQRHRLPGAQLQVTGTAEGDQGPEVVRSAELSDNRQQVEIVGEDILPLHRGALGPQRDGFLPKGLALLLSPLLFGLGLVLERRRLRSEDVQFVRRSGAARQLKGALDEAEALTGKEGAALLSRATRVYLGDRLGVAGSALTADEAEALLRSEGLDEEVVGDVGAVLRSLEAARYAGAGDLGGLRQRVEALLPQLERGT